jgi:23S rRNA (uracil1939-C5)-methyltransferase
MSTKFEAIVRDLSHKGLGVVDHPDGRVFFVRGVWPGDKGLFEADALLEKYSEIKLIELLTPSPERVEISCSFRGTEAGKCGGCPWMMASYPAQLNYKVKRLQHALEKRKINTSDILKPVWASPDVFHYRNRIQLKTDGKKLGYVSEGTSVFAPVEDCRILNEKLSELFHELKDSLPRDDLIPGENHKWAFVDLDDEMSLADVLPNKRRPFRQGNSKQNEAMKNWLREKLINVPKHFPVIDLFCGSGNFTEVLSLLGFENILAVEVQGSALRELERKNLPGVRILPLDMNEKGSWAKVARLQPHAKILITDPPREGMEKRRGLFKYLDNLQDILYISCELDTFSRDTADLVSQFRLQEITPIDLFPHTPHLEMMAHFQRETAV